jgi:hypothetical protein
MEVNLLSAILQKTGPNVIQTRSTPFNFDVKKNTSYTIYNIATSVNGNSYTGATTITGTTPNTDGYSETLMLDFVDDTNPTAIAQNVTIYLGADGKASTSAADVNDGSLDNCEVASLSLSKTEFDCSNVGPNNVILTVTDVNSNVSTSNAVVTVVDNIAPTAKAQSVTIYLGADGKASTSAADVNDGSFDNCEVASLSLSKTEFDCSNVGPNNVILTVTDVNSNVSTSNAVVTVVDNIAPTAKAQSVTIYLGADGKASTSAADVNDGSLDNCEVASLSLSKTEFDCSNVGPNNVILTVTDVNSNVSTSNAVVTVVDNIAPTAKAQSVTIYLGADGKASTSAADVNDGSFDNCEVASLSLSKTEFDCSNVGPNNVILTVTDVNSNVSTSNAVVTVVDNIAPTAKAQSVTIYLGADGKASTSAADVNDGSLDNCEVASLSLSKTEFDCSNVGPNNVILTVTDVNSNVSTSNAVVTVVDNIAPTAKAQSVTIYLGADGKASTSAADVNDGSFDNCEVASLSLSKTEFDCSNVGPNNVILTVTDVNSNVSTSNAVVTVVDNIAPTAKAQSVTIYLGADGKASTSAADVNDGSFDNCEVASLSLSKTEFDCSNVGPNNVILTVTDVNSNVSTSNAVVTVVDNIAPTAKAQSVTIYLGADGKASTSAADVNDGSLDNCEVASLSLSKTEFDCSNVGPNNVILTVTDVNSNVSTSNAVVTVVDNIAPTAKAQNVTIYLGADGKASTSAADVNDGSLDNCEVASLSLSKTEFDCSNVGPNNVILTVTDVNSNVSTSNAVVTVVDNIAPTAKAQNVTIYLGADGKASTSAADVNDGSFDNCEVASLSLSKTEFDCSNVGPNNVILTVTDVNSNVSTSNAVVTVVDNIAPTAKAQSVTIYLGADGKASTSAADVNDGSFDNCEVASLSLSKTEFDCSNVGPNNVILTVTDVNSNVSTSNAVVTVVDNIAPTAKAQSVTIYLGADGKASTSAADVNDGSFDNCEVASLSLSKTEFDCSNVGPNNVILTVTDVNSNVSTSNAVVTVVDNIAPTAKAQSVTIYLGADGKASTSAADVNDGSFDNCEVASLSLSKTEFDCSNVGPNNVILTVTDVNSNVSTSNAVVTVVDNIAPTAKAQSVTIYLGADGKASTSAADVNDGSFDNCEVASLSLSKTEFDCSNVGPNNVILTVTDVNSNVSTSNAVVTVVDNIAPVITRPSDITQHVDAGSCEAIVTFEAAATDNCSALVTYSTDPGTSFPRGTTTVRATATDPSGNMATCTFNVTITNSSPSSIVFDGPIEPKSLGTEIVMSASFMDENIKQATWRAFDGSIDIQSVTYFKNDNNGNLDIESTTHTFKNLPAGVYTIKLTLKDYCEEETTENYQYVVIYDPNGGFVTGGGWILSPAGAYTPNVTLTGKATFGFVSKYKKGTNVPEGNTEFQFHAGNLNFKSSEYEGGSLVVAGSKAIYKGKGTINGNGDYGFMVSAVDGQVSGGGGVDMFRIKIWDKASGLIVYDNNIGNDDNAIPSTALSGGSIVIHSVKSGAKGMDDEESVSIKIVPDPEFAVKAYPNPFTDHVYFDLQLKTDSKVRLEIYNSAGAKIATVFDDMVVAFDRYRFEYTPGNLSSSVLIYRIFIDNKMSFTGKLIHK